MKYLGLYVFFLALVLFAVALMHHSAEMPERIVSRFNESGKPSGRMDSGSFLLNMMVTGLSLPAVLTALMYAVRFLSPSLLNTPYPDYWRKPENFKRGCDFLFRSSFWFSSAFVIWTKGFFCAVVAANEMKPPRMDLMWILILTSFLIIASSAWGIVLFAMFTRKPPVEE